MCHEMVCLKVHGRFLNVPYMSVVYIEIYILMINSISDCKLIQSVNVKSFVIVGDVNAHHRDWFGSVSNTDVHGVAAYDLASSARCWQFTGDGILIQTRLQTLPCAYENLMVQSQ